MNEASYRPDPATEETLKSRDFTNFLQGLPNRARINDWLDRQDISADAKNVMRDISGMAVQVGNVLIPLGRKIIATIATLIKQFQGVVFGLVVASVILFLIGSVPLIGGMLGAVMAPLLYTFGLTMGAVNDFSAMTSRRKLETLEAEYAILKG